MTALTFTVSTVQWSAVFAVGVAVVDAVRRRTNERPIELQVAAVHRSVEGASVDLARGFHLCLVFKEHSDNFGELVDHRLAQGRSTCLVPLLYVGSNAEEFLNELTVV